MNIMWIKAKRVILARETYLLWWCRFLFRLYFSYSVYKCVCEWIGNGKTNSNTERKGLCFIYALTFVRLSLSKPASLSFCCCDAIHAPCPVIQESIAHNVILALNRGLGQCEHGAVDS
uniref:Uncharacterized protein n=1 Tax=Monopterus albus TaxID=43700 RepID=A0A3Q3K7M5_MONAL